MAVQSRRRRVDGRSARERRHLHDKHQNVFQQRKRDGHKPRRCDGAAGHRQGAGALYRNACGRRGDRIRRYVHAGADERAGDGHRRRRRDCRHLHRQTRTRGRQRLRRVGPRGDGGKHCDRSCRRRSQLRSDRNRRPYPLGAVQSDRHRARHGRQRRNGRGQDILRRDGHDTAGRIPCARGCGGSVP